MRGSQAAPRRAIVAVMFGLGALVAGPAVASAFQMVSPTPWVIEDALGDPQALPPCGVSPLACYTPTGAVTTFIAGQEIMVNWVENVPSDGWFRIALSTQNRANLMDPAVAIDDAGLAIDAAIAPEADPDAAPLGINTYSFPILADGLFPHVAADITDTPYLYSWSLILPAGVTCDRCTLQVIQFLGNHSDNLPNGNPSGYYAHHCADIQIVPAVDGGASPVGYDGTLSFDPDAGGPTAACTVADASADDGSDGAVGQDDAGQGPAPSDDAGTTTEAGSSDAESADDAGSPDEGGPSPAGGPGSSGGGCGCVASGAGEGSLAASAGAMMAIAALAQRRRRRA